MKFALFVVYALVAIQDFQVRSVDVQPPSIPAIISDIQEAVSRLVQIIGAIASQFPGNITGIVDQIEKIAGQIGQIIASIGQAIKDLFQQGEVAAACVEEQREGIDELIDFANRGLQNCTEQAEVLTLRKQISDLVSRVLDLQINIVKSTATCVQEISNPVAMIDCLVQQVGPIIKQIGDIQAEVEESIAEAQAANAAAALTKCSLQLQQEINEQQQQLFQDINSCIKANQTEL